MKGYNPELNRQVEAVAVGIRAKYGMKKYQPPQHREDKCEPCKGLGYIARNAGYDKLATASDVCPACNGKGFVIIVIKGDER